MDAIQSPQDDGFLTLPGQDSRTHSDRSKSPSPSPSPSPFSSLLESQTMKHNQLEQQQREAGSVESIRSTESLPHARGHMQQREAWSVESVHSAESLPHRDRRREREASRSISPRCILGCSVFVLLHVLIGHCHSTCNSIQIGENTGMITAFFHCFLTGLHLPLSVTPMTTGTPGEQPHQLQGVGAALGPAAVPLGSTWAWPQSRFCPGLVTGFRVEGVEKGGGERGERVHHSLP